MTFVMAKDAPTFALDNLRAALQEAKDKAPETVPFPMVEVVTLLSFLDEVLKEHEPCAQRLEEEMVRRKEAVRVSEAKALEYEQYRREIEEGALSQQVAELTLQLAEQTKVAQKAQESAADMIKKTQDRAKVLEGEYEPRMAVLEAEVRDLRQYKADVAVTLAVVQAAWESLPVERG